MAQPPSSGKHKAIMEIVSKYLMRMGADPSCRQCNMEAGAATCSRRNLDAAFVGSNAFIDHRQANAGAVNRRLTLGVAGLIKRLEYSFAFCRGDAGTLVAHHKRNRVRSLCRADSYSPAFGRELDRVGEQVVDDQLYAITVGGQHYGLIGLSHGQIFASECESLSMHDGCN